MAIINTMSGYNLTGITFFEIVAAMKSIAIAIITKNKGILLIHDIIAPMMLRIGIPKRKNTTAGFSKFKLRGLLSSFLSLKYAATAHAKVRLFRVGNKYTKEIGC